MEFIPGRRELTFAMARHAAVDLAQVVNARYDPAAPDRLPDADYNVLRETLAEAGLKLRSTERGAPETKSIAVDVRALLAFHGEKSDGVAAAVETSDEDAGQLAGGAVGSGDPG